MTNEQQKIIKAFVEGDTWFLWVIRFLCIIAFIVTMVSITPLDVFGDEETPEPSHDADVLNPPSIVPGGVTIENYTDNNGVLHQCTYVCSPVGRTRVCNTVCL